MASVNKVILIGNLGADPETRYLPSGAAVCNFNIATTEKWKDGDGEQKEHTEWHRISVFGKLAEIASEYLKKGHPVYIEGKIRTNKYQDREGIDRYSVNIICEKIVFLKAKEREEGGRSYGDEKPRPRQQEKPASKSPGGFDQMDDDIPF